MTNYVNNITSQTGLPVYITEMDVGEADDNTQMTKIKDVVTPLWANDQVKGITYWGLPKEMKGIFGELNLNLALRCILTPPWSPLWWLWRK